MEVIKYVRDFADGNGVKDVFMYAAVEEKIFERVVSENGYTRKTTFFKDLSIGEYISGCEGVRDTYESVIQDWLSNVEYFAEFVLALNHKCWEWHERKNDTLARLYGDLYYAARDLGFDAYDKEPWKWQYFYNTID